MAAATRTLWDGGRRTPTLRDFSIGAFSLCKANDIKIVVKRFDDNVHVEAFWRGSRVGYAWCEKNANRLHISDFNVESEFPCPARGIEAFLFPSRRNRTKNFRKQGLGSTILQRVIDECTKEGLSEIWGGVVQLDLDATPQLLEWYARRGFEIIEPDAETREAAKKISMKFAPLKVTKGE
jgi:GNAT superfamily N-acetyltransferase